MPNMPNPFSQALIGKKLTKYDLIQMVRQDIVGELEAIYLYDAHANASDDPVVKTVLADIRNEEREHVGELMTLLKYLDPAEEGLLAEGEGEVREMMANLGIATGDDSVGDSGATIGSLK